LVLFREYHFICQSNSGPSSHQKTATRRKEREREEKEAERKRERAWQMTRNIFE